MKKHIDITAIENVEKLFDYSRKLLLDDNPTHNGKYTNLLQEICKSLDVPFFIENSNSFVKIVLHVF